MRRIQTPKLACDSGGSIDDLNGTWYRPSSTLEFPVHVKGQTYQTSFHTNTSRRAAWEFCASFSEVEKAPRAPPKQPARAVTRADEVARTRLIRGHARSKRRTRGRASTTLAVTARSPLPERGREEFSRVRRDDPQPTSRKARIALTSSRSDIDSTLPVDLALETRAARRHGGRREDAGVGARRSERRARGRGRRGQAG